MRKKRIFSKEKLKELSKGYTTLALEALEKKDIEKAKYWIKRYEDTRYDIHDILVHGAVAVGSYIYRHYGEDAANRAIKEGVQGFSASWAAAKKAIFEEQGVGAWVEFVADTWRKHYGRFTVTEDDEKIIFTHHPCGSGGRLVEMEAYDGPFGYARLEKPAFCTWGEKDVPIYCSHCSWAHEILPILVAGAGAQFWIHATPFPRKPGDKCVHYIYKDPEKIPDEYYERIGMKKSPKQMPHV